MGIKSILIPTIVIFLGYLLQAHVIPYLHRSYHVMGLSRTHSQLPPEGSCAVAHQDKFLGCEDIHIYKKEKGTTYIFAACLAAYENRWRTLSRQRAIDKENRPVPTPPGDKIWRWRLETDEVVELELPGFPEGGDERAWHGFDFIENANGTLSFYIINHRVSGSTIEKFTHEPDAKNHILTHSATFPLPENGIGKHPNDVYAYPDPTGRDIFYVTSEHRYDTGITRTIEDYTRRPWSHLAYYSPETGWKVIKSGLAGANGLTGTKPTDGGPARIYLSELLAGNIIILEHRPDVAGEVREIQTVPLGFLPDNPALSSDEKDLYIAGHVTPLRSYKHFSNPESVSTGSAVARIALSQTGSDFFGGRDEYTSTPAVEEIFVDLEGKLINGSSTSVFWDRLPPVGAPGEEEEEEEVERGEVVAGDLFITGLTGRGILRCKEFKYDASDDPTLKEEQHEKTVEKDDHEEEE
ncbi:calcium-dependent phosphotriesterase [Tuber magnatum]|uniref:Calcium-dependent phosphotriesterase n=1 Tax=Tuber magnatum TaxID=42249 RepID=A0A317SBF1_9PEZI|nr:calcium-dependent phosphotriesterase [Tuber magnatum]